MERGVAEHVAQGVIGAGHPCLPGHFPGHPVVPAVVLLDFAARALGEALGCGVRIVAIPAVKFLRPCLPEQPFTVSLQIDETARTVRFSIAGAGAGTELANGRFEYADAA